MASQKQIQIIIWKQKGKGFIYGKRKNKKVARRGGGVAGIDRQALEAETGKPVITSKNAVDFARLIDEIVKEVEQPQKGTNVKNNETK